MKKVQKNSFEKMCDRLEENFVLNENEIKYVKKHLYPIKEDKDMLLKLKAEALEDSCNVVCNYNVGIDGSSNNSMRYYAIRNRNAG